ncbi:hypothetical protein FGM00_06675 [Aggregatimonas sangjinii]|uniref:DNA primase n=1 Tax=Aggregatimonas sangjinii TaxID=2583587 RepID=A0A5B7SRZ6_9FLAO|nr:hypothetical protein [Aggregatimonas sangjinii]QCW99797.1 hypothetical protein FGM00_06675 [Aggregatimonas sangjinii]
MTRRLVDYKKLSHELAALLIETYPYGYGDEDIIAFKNANGEYVEAVEIRTDDCLYLVKISKSLANFISNFEDTIEKELESKPEPILEEVDASEMEKEMNAETDFEEDSDFD